MKRKIVKQCMGFALSALLLFSSSGIALAAQDVQTDETVTNIADSDINSDVLGDSEETNTAETETSETVESTESTESTADTEAEAVTETVTDAAALSTSFPETVLQKADGTVNYVEKAEASLSTRALSSSVISVTSGNHTFAKYPTIIANLDSSYQNVVVYLYNTTTTEEYSLELDYSSIVNQWGIRMIIDGTVYNGKYLIYAISYTKGGKSSVDTWDSPPYFNVTGSRTLEMDKFVRRLYDLVLGRTAGDSEVEYWSKGLAEKTRTGASCAHGFIFSDEYKKKNKTNSEYVDTLYKSLLDRSADAGGKNDWLNRMTVGVSRTYILKGFAESAEFTKLCTAYGITRGSITVSENRDKNYGITSFVSRLYTKALGRSIDVTGLNHKRVHSPMLAS